MKAVCLLLLVLAAGAARAQLRAPAPADSTLRMLAAYEAVRKDPFVALTCSFFLPGGAFFYLGDPGQAMACIGIEGVTVLWMVDMADLHPRNPAPYIMLGLERVLELFLAVSETDRRNGLLRESLGLRAGFDRRRGATVSLTFAF